jgi:hypothetical protein
MPGQEQTIDASTFVSDVEKGLGEGTTLKKGTTKVIMVGKQKHKATKYTIENKAEKQKIEIWHSPRIPPVFSGGAVKLTADMMGQPMTMNLVEYNGPLL